MKLKISSLFRAKILMRRECLVWLKRKGESKVFYGWMLGCDERRVIFKLRGCLTAALSLGHGEIESFGCARA